MIPKKSTSTRSKQDTNFLSQTQSHFLVPSEKLDKVTRRVIAPYAQIERKGLKDEEENAGRYLDINRFNVFLEDTVDLESLLYETAMVLKTVTDSSGVFVYIVDKLKNEIVLLHPDTNNPERHEVNMTICEGQTAAAHVAYTKEFLLLEDVQRDRRFSEGLRWIDAKVALCMPVVKPDGDCYAVLELYRTFAKTYDDAQGDKHGSLSFRATQVLSEHGCFVKYLCRINREPDARCHHYVHCREDTVQHTLAECTAWEEPRRAFVYGMKSVVYTVVSVACWAGAAVHQAQARVVLQKTAHLNSELRTLLQNYFCDLASIDTMLTDMLTVVKSFIGAMRSSFYIIDKEHIGDMLQADMWDDGWSNEKTTMPRKKLKVNLSYEQTPAGYVARTGETLNVRDAYKDSRFAKEIDPTTGTVVRSCLVSPITDKNGVIGVVQLTNKTNAQPFDSDDELIFSVFVSYCSLIVHFYNMQQMKIFHANLNSVYFELMGLHLKPCHHDLDELIEACNVVVVPPNFKSYDYHISENSKEDMPGLVWLMFSETFCTSRHFDMHPMADFILSVLGSYRNNPYHNAEHAFCFTHTMYLILINNVGPFDIFETIALMLSGLCHDVDHPGFNNNFLSLVKHPLAGMYKTSMLENHHFFLAQKMIQDKNILARFAKSDQERILDEIKYDILCTDLAVYFQIRAQLTPLLAEHVLDWSNIVHRKMLKGILMTTSDLSGCCKPFGVSKAIAESVYQEFYEQGDRERDMGYTPLSMMDRRRSVNQPAEQIQFLSVVVLPCLLILQNVFPNTSGLTDNCRKTQEAWHEEIEIRGQKLWRQDDAVPNGRSSRLVTVTKLEHDE